MAVFFLGALMVLMVQFLSGLSMRQPLETAITYSLSSINILGILLTLSLGLNLIAKEIESSSIYTILSNPIRRSEYILGKFLGLSILLFGLAAILGVCASSGIALVALKYDCLNNVAWQKIIISLLGIYLALTLLGSITIALTTIATSSIFPFVLTCAAVAIGYSIQPAKTFIDSEAGKEMFSPAMKALVHFIYYILPNFSFFDFKAFAIYNLPLADSMIFFSLSYWALYTGIMLMISICVFDRKDLI